MPVNASQKLFDILLFVGGNSSLVERAKKNMKAELGIQGSDPSLGWERK